MKLDTMGSSLPFAPCLVEPYLRHRQAFLAQWIEHRPTLPEGPLKRVTRPAVPSSNLGKGAGLLFAGFSDLKKRNNRTARSRATYGGGACFVRRQPSVRRDVNHVEGVMPPFPTYNYPGKGLSVSVRLAEFPGAIPGTPTLPWSLLTTGWSCGSPAANGSAVRASLRRVAPFLLGEGRGWVGLWTGFTVDLRGRPRRRG